MAGLSREKLRECLCDGTFTLAGGRLGIQAGKDLCDSHLRGSLVATGASFVTDTESLMSVRGNLVLGGARWNGRQVEVRFPISGGIVSGMSARISLPDDIGVVDSGAGSDSALHLDTGFLPCLGAGGLALLLETRDGGGGTTAPFAGVAAEVRGGTAGTIRLVSWDADGPDGPVSLGIRTVPPGTDGDGDPGATAEELLAAFGMPVDEAPPQALSMRLTGLRAAWDPGSPGRQLVLHGRADGGNGSLLLGSLESGGGRGEPRAGAVMCVDDADVGLSGLPLVGGAVPREWDIGVRGFGSGTRTAAVDPDLMDGLNERAEALTRPLGVPPVAFPRDLASGGPWSRITVLALPGDKVESLGAPASRDGTVRPVWKEISQRIGKLYVRRIGIVYEEPTLWLMVDGTLALGPLEFQAVGLGIGLRTGSFPSFRLDGLGVGFKKEPFALSGGLIWNSDEPEKYEMLLEGEVALSVPELDLLALAAYARTKDPAFTSLFVFVRADSGSGEGSEAPVGIGVPPVLLTGFCIGFGYNYALRLPKPEEVRSFPLLRGMTDGGESGASSRKAVARARKEKAPEGPLDALEDLADWVSPQDGAYWGVLGARATVFEKLNIWAVVLVTFDDDGVSAAVIGLLGARFPQKKGELGDKVYIDVQAAVIAEYVSSSGLLAVGTSVAAETVVLSQKARVTGGMAVYTWLAGAHRGEFVYTMGGYHPGFQVPDHYPRPPQPLALDFSPSDAVGIRATAYLALSPGWFMVGGALDFRAEVTFPGGYARVWADASFDAVIDWHPFHLEAGVGLSGGAEVKFLAFHPKLELSLSLDVWLPPFGAEATAHLPFGITVSLGFGASKSDRPSPLTWGQFVDQQLPAAKDTRLRAVPSGGMLAPGGAGGDGQQDPGDPGASPWLVSARGFSFTTSCVAPATQVEVNGRALDGVDGTRRLDVRPMGADGGTGLHSVHSVTIVHHGDDGDETVAWWGDGWSVEPVTESVPAALWGAPLSEGTAPPTDAGLVPDRYTGVRVTVPPAALSPADDPLTISASVLRTDTPNQDSYLPLGPGDLPPGGQPVPVADPGAVAVIAGRIADDAVAARRNGLARLLGDDGPTRLVCDPLLRYADRASRGLLNAPPLLLPHEGRQEAGSPR